MSSDLIVCCSLCRQPIFAVKPQDFHQPLRASMFKLLKPWDYVIPPGAITCQTYCPKCYGGPFYYDRYAGKVEQKLLLMKASGEKEVVEVPAKPTEPIKKATSWPCQECGAIKNFHKRGCSRGD